MQRPSDAGTETDGPGQCLGHASTETGAPGNGQPSDRATWHSRGYLPHFESATVIQHVTFHLADSLPEMALAPLEEEMKFLPDAKRDVERRKRVQAWIDAGHGSCILREPQAAAMVQSCLLHFDACHYRLLAWVVMPNHVHVLFQFIDGWSVADIVDCWKKFTGRQIAEHRGFTPGRSEGVWQHEYWDRYIRHEGHFRQAVEYIHKNPVKAGLVRRGGRVALEQRRSQQPLSP